MRPRGCCTNNLDMQSSRVGTHACIDVAAATNNLKMQSSRVGTQACIRAAAATSNLDMKFSRWVSEGVGRDPTYSSILSLPIISFSSGNP